MFSVVLSCLAFGVALLALLRAWLDHRSYLKERNKMAADLAEAERLIKYRGNLANEIAHEIKNPITAILCSAETLDLLLGDQLGEDHRRSLHYIKEFGDSLLRLVSNFLDVSRAEAGKIVCRPQSIQVSSVVDAIIGLLQPSALRKEIDLKNLSSDRTLRALVDPIHIKQVLFNLLYNAIKFTPRGGEVQVSVESSFPQPFIEISIRDNGPGIPADYLPNLFDPYTRYEHKRSDDSGDLGPGVGVGLGLALCKSLVELAKGIIRVESQEGVGSVFYVRLPVVDVREPISSGINKLKENTTHNNELLKGQNILILEQDHGTRDSVARLIEAWGGSVRQVGDAIEAVNALAQSDFSSVIVDAKVIEEDTSELINKLASSVNSNNTRIVFAEENGFPDDLPSNDKSSDGFRRIQKPFSGERLLKVLTDS